MTQRKLAHHDAGHPRLNLQLVDANFVRLCLIHLMEDLEQGLGVIGDEPAMTISWLLHQNHSKLTLHNRLRVASDLIATSPHVKFLDSLINPKQTQRAL